MTTSKLTWVNFGATTMPKLKAATPNGTWLLEPSGLPDDPSWDLYHSQTGDHFVLVIHARSEEAGRQVAAFVESRMQPQTKHE